MKKLIAMMMALVLALAVGYAAFAESSDNMMAQQENWLRDSLTNAGWMEKSGERTTLDIEPSLSDESPFKATLIRSNGADESLVMTFFCDYDPDIHTLNARRVVCVRENYTEGSDEPSVTEIYDKESVAVFELDEEGFLTLRNEAYVDGDENDIFLVGFEKVIGEEKGAELTEETKAACEKALEGILGVTYTPLKVLAEEGTRLCVLCEATVIVPDAVPVSALLFIDTTAEGKSFPTVLLLNDDGSEG